MSMNQLAIKQRASDLPLGDCADWWLALPEYGICTVKYQYLPHMRRTTMESEKSLTPTRPCLLHSLGSARDYLQLSRNPCADSTCKAKGQSGPGFR